MRRLGPGSASAGTWHLMSLTNTGPRPRESVWRCLSCPGSSEEPGPESGCGRVGAPGQPLPRARPALPPTRRDCSGGLSSRADGSADLHPHMLLRGGGRCSEVPAEPRPAHSARALSGATTTATIATWLCVSHHCQRRGNRDERHQTTTQGAQPAVGSEALSPACEACRSPPPGRGHRPRDPVSQVFPGRAGLQHDTNNYMSYS